MPNRILRDWTDSFTVNALDAFSERFFTRLIMKVDDFGRFHADHRMLSSSLFPLRTDIRDTDISRWLAACEKAGLVRCYHDVKSRKFLQIQNFKQRTRQMESKFPSPDGQLPLNGLSTAHVFGDGDGDGDEGGNARPPAGPAVHQENSGAEIATGAQEVPDQKKAVDMAKMRAVPEDFALLCFKDWTGNNGCDANNKPKPWLGYVEKRWRYEGQEWKNGTHRGKKGAVTSAATGRGPKLEELRSYAREKLGNDARIENWVLSFFRYWNNPKLNWEKNGVVIDWKVEFSAQLSKWRSA